MAEPRIPDFLKGKKCCFRRKQHNFQSSCPSLMGGDLNPLQSPLHYQKNKGCNRPTRYSEPLRSKVGEIKRSSPVRVEIGRKGSLWLQLINYDFLSA